MLQAAVWRIFASWGFSGAELALELGQNFAGAAEAATLTVFQRGLRQFAEVPCVTLLQRAKNGEWPANSTFHERDAELRSL